MNNLISFMLHRHFNMLSNGKSWFTALQNSMEYILLSDIFGGVIKIFATLQNYYEKLIPHWFLNLDELLTEFQEQGYSLVMKNYVTARRLDVEDTFPIDNFRVDHRLPNTLHLLFRRKTENAHLR